MGKMLVVFSVLDFSAGVDLGMALDELCICLHFYCCKFLYVVIIFFLQIIKILKIKPKFRCSSKKL